MSGTSKNTESTNTEPIVIKKPETVPVLLKADSLEVISSESEDGVAEAECDSDAIDVNVIEADMDLEELMKQKELLQAEIAKADMESTVPTEKLAKAAPAAIIDEVILVDDSSNDEGTPAKKQKKSHSRERRIVIEKKGDARNAREDLRRKRPEPLLRDQAKIKDRNYKEPLKYSSESRDKDHNRRNFNNRRSLERSSMDQSRFRMRDRDNYERHRPRDNRYDSNRNQQYRMDHHHHHRSSFKDRRHKERSKTSRVDKQDKFKDSLSEGMKHGGSSDSEIDVNINLNDDEEDEQKIIERRRKQREELMKVCLFTFLYIYCLLRQNYFISRKRTN